MTGGLSEPLSNARQYIKNIGRDIELTFENSEKLSGEIVAADENAVTLLLRYRKPKDIGKGKVDVEEEKVIAYTDIKKAIILIKF